MAVFDRRRELRRSAGGTTLLLEIDGDPKDALECGCDDVRGTVVTLWPRTAGRDPSRVRIPDRNRRVLLALADDRWVLATIVRASPEAIEVRPVLPSTTP